MSDVTYWPSQFSGRTFVSVFHSGKTHTFTARASYQSFSRDLRECTRACKCVRKEEADALWRKFFPYLTKRQVRLIKNK